MAVTGIGGFFFRSADPKGLLAWYREHFGLMRDGYSPPWQQEAGSTIFAPFAMDTDYFPADHTWMLNLRVTDLDGMLAALTTAGIATITNPEWDQPGFGRFARLYDPEGNPIELWEPAAE